MEYSEQTLYIADLARLEGVNHVIEDSTFENCQLRGPAVVALFGTTASEGEVVIPNQDAETVVVVAEEGRVALPIGVVVIRNSTFKNCSFEGISFFGNAQEAEQYRTTFMRNVPTS